MTLHTAFTAGQILFAGMMFLAIRSSPGNGRVRVVYLRGPNDDLYFYIALGLVMAAAIASYYAYRQKVAQARSMGSLSDITAGYKSAMLLRDACLQGPSILAAIAFLLSGNERYLALTGFIILIFLTWWPTREKVLNDLGLEGEDRARLEDPEGLI